MGTCPDCGCYEDSAGRHLCPTCASGAERGGYRPQGSKDVPNPPHGGTGRVVPDASPAPDALREIIRQEIEPWLADRHDRFGWGDYPLMAEEIDEHLDAIMVKVSNRVKVLAKQSEERKELIYQESVRAQKAEARVKVLEEALREISKRLHYSDTTYESGPVEVHRHLCELMEIADAALASMTGDEVRVPQGQEIRAVGGHTGTSNPVVVTGFAGKEEKK